MWKMSDLSAYHPRTRFTGREADYAKYRPTYPQAAIDWILEGLGDPRRLRVADLGAGTGISARLFAERGANVVAIEPNPDMLAAGRRHTRVRNVCAAAEETGLPARSFNLAIAFQAFHWFARDAATAEVRRILKPRGRFALAWNNRDRADAFTAAYGALIESFGEEAIAVERGKLLAPVEQTLRDSGFERFARSEFAHFHRMDRQSLLGYARSASYLPAAGAGLDRLHRGLDVLFERFADGEGFVTFAYRAVAFRGDAAPAGTTA